MKRNRCFIFSATLIALFSVSCKQKTENVNPFKQGYKNIVTPSSIINSEHKGISKSESIPNLFDENKNTKFLVTAPKNTIVITNKEASVLKKYKITSADDAPGRDPKNWSISGSLDGENWEVLDTKTDQTFAQRKETVSFDLEENTTAYSSYKITLEQTKTSVYGDNYLQIAEIEFLALTEQPIAEFLAVQTRGEILDTIQFNDISANAPDHWEWMFESGIPEVSTEQNPQVVFKTPGNHAVTLMVKNKHGKDSLTLKRYIKVYDPENPWNGFHYPEIVFTSTDTISEGYKRAITIIPDFKQAINEVTLGVCKQLYKNISEVPDFEKVNFTFNWSNTLAARGGNSTVMDLWFSTKYIQNALQNEPDDAVKYEIYGVLWHELTHGYQFSPKTADNQYKPGYDYFAFLEGEADLVRINAGYHKTRRPDLGVGEYKYLMGYTTTGFFLKWIVDTYDKDFIYKFNKSVQEITPWSYKKAFQTILNKDVDTLWNEYTVYVNEYIKNNPVVEKKKIDWIHMN
ncbi:basic secretory protein-like protein [Tenacibaculum sp. TC6]|uniref:basic secretory protein-like protein n=1 Tax=Tenacibaculum sp. TC6 TaxID=3423223 RepID=UPI003D36E3FC